MKKIIFKGVKFLLKTLLFLFLLSGIIVAAFAIFFIGFHSDLETKYRTIEVVTFENHIELKDGIPLYDLFCKLAKQPYSINQFDCSNKSLVYAEACKAKGLDVKFLLTLRGQLGHAVVYVDKYGIYDTTNNSYTHIPGTRDPVREYEHDPFLTYMYGQLLYVMTIDEAKKAYPDEFK